MTEPIDEVFDPFSQYPTLALFAHPNMTNETYVMAGEQPQDGVATLMICARELSVLVEICDQFINDLVQQRQIFIERSNNGGKNVQRKH